MEDKELYKEFIEGNQEAFETLVKKYKNNLKYFIYKYVKNEEATDDVFQDTMMYILSRKEVFNEKYNFKTFLYMVAKSRALNYLKKYNNINIINEESICVEERMLEDIIISKERKEKIKNVIRKMNEEYQQAVYLGIIEGLPYNEIALIMGKTTSQVKNLIHRARVTLRKLLIAERVVEMKKKEEEYKNEFSLEHNKTLEEKDVLKIPYIKINEEINYDELCGKYIKGTDWYIRQALQNIDFSLNNSGGSVKSEALIEMRKSAIVADMNKIDYIFDSEFLLFIKEKNKEKPYFALKVDNTDVLVKE